MAYALVHSISAFNNDRRATFGVFVQYTQHYGTGQEVSFQGGYPENLLQKWQESLKYLFGERAPNDQGTLFLKCGDIENTFPLMFGLLQVHFEACKVGAGEECYLSKRSFPLSTSFLTRFLISKFLRNMPPLPTCH